MFPSTHSFASCLSNHDVVLLPQIKFPFYPLSLSACRPKIDEPWAFPLPSLTDNKISSGRFPAWEESRYRGFLIWEAGFFIWMFQEGLNKLPLKGPRVRSLKKKVYIRVNLVDKWLAPLNFSDRDINLSHPNVVLSPSRTNASPIRVFLLFLILSCNPSHTSFTWPLWATALTRIFPRVLVHVSPLSSFTLRNIIYLVFFSLILYLSSTSFLSISHLARGHYFSSIFSSYLLGASWSGDHMLWGLICFASFGIWVG